MADPEHLAMIQGVITRMGNNSFLIKGWSVTLVAGLSAFAADKSDASFALIAVGVVPVFALLDAYYLAIERAYRELFKEYAAWTAPTDWKMSVGKIPFLNVLATLGRPAVYALHGPTLAAAIAVVVLAS